MEHDIIKINVLRGRGLLNTIFYIRLCTVHGQVRPICIFACHSPIMDNPENKQHFNVLI